ncbi:MAG: carboxypeptidase-like regulatory domain-containing protein [Candidatus Bathyarchaeota archaeon]|nr:carboxypeptidase-like regulatory domain-containing protein [Candidatus Bathyarchaeota archaeon]
MKHKAITITFIAVICVAMLVMPFSTVSGQIGLYIYQITKAGGTTAITSVNVGDAVNLVGTLYSANSSYKVYFGDILVDSNQSSGYYVSSNFTIPDVPAGSYTVTLQDVAVAYNTTSSLTVNTAYIAEAVVPSSPALLQEGDLITINVAITGGQPNTSHTANITVVLPSPLATPFTQLVPLTVGSSGSGRTQITFPSGSFQPSGSTTIYTGQYTIYFNQSQNLGQRQFYVGITDASSYHRQSTVKIRAVGYQAGQSAALKIVNAAGTTMFSQTVTASDQGIITSTWTIPSTAPLGQYNVTITPQSNFKAVPDSQNFTLPGYKITVNTLNLAGNYVPYLTIKAVDHSSNTETEWSSGYYGSTLLNLESGNHTITAYWDENVKVGELKVSISGDATYNITCQLTNLLISVKDKNGVAIPNVKLDMTYNYVTATGETKTGNFSTQTNSSGTYLFDSALPGVTYMITASKYGVVFNTGNNTVSNLPAQPLYAAVIVCPEKTLVLKTLDYHTAALPNARIDLMEQESGIFYTATTNGNGDVSLQVTFGQYRVRVYSSENILLNETTLSVLDNTQSQIRCATYNLQVSVKVVDYFGNAISNVNVQLSRQGASPRVAVTQGDGTVTFQNVIGGNIDIMAYITGSEGSYIAENIYVDSPTAVQLQMANYVALGPLLIGTNALIASLLILIVLALFVLAEVFQRKTFKLWHRKIKN